MRRLHPAVGDVALQMTGTNMELFAVEIRTEHWSANLAWYREALGLQVAVRIPEDEYALLISGSNRIALMGRKSPGTNERVSLAFEVQDLDACEQALDACDTEFRRIHDHAEGLAIISTADPDGNPINLFKWPSTDAEAE